LVGRNFKLSCSEVSKPHIERLAENLDLELGKILKSNSSASFEMLLVMIALCLMDEKYSKTKESAGEVLEKTEKDHHKQLSTLFDELKNVANKF
jgi:cell division protein ZapA (FtsZ GTPase activity inhibitor)